MKFWDSSHNFYYFGKKLGPDVIFPTCQGLQILFHKIWVNLEQIIIFYLCSYFTLRFKKMIFDTFIMKSIDFLSCKMPKE